MTTTTDDDYPGPGVLASDPLLRWDAIAAHARDHHGFTWPTDHAAVTAITGAFDAILPGACWYAPDDGTTISAPAPARPAALVTRLDRPPGTQLHHRRPRRQRSPLRPPGHLRRDQHPHPPGQPAPPEPPGRAARTGMPASADGPRGADGRKGPRRTGGLLPAPDYLRASRPPPGRPAGVARDRCAALDPPGRPQHPAPMPEQPARMDQFPKPPASAGKTPESPASALRRITEGRAVNTET